MPCGRLCLGEVVIKSCFHGFKFGCSQFALAGYGHCPTQALRHHGRSANCCTNNPASATLSVFPDMPCIRSPCVRLRERAIAVVSAGQSVTVILPVPRSPLRTPARPGLQLHIHSPVLVVGIQLSPPCAGACLCLCEAMGLSVHERVAVADKPCAAQRMPPCLRATCCRK